MGISCCLLDPRTDSHQPELLLIAPDFQKLQLNSYQSELSLPADYGNFVQQQSGYGR